MKQMDWMAICKDNEGHGVIINKRNNLHYNSNNIIHKDFNNLENIRETGIICYGTWNKVAIIDSKNQILSCTGGEHWSIVPIPDNGSNCSGIAYGDDVFVIIKNNADHVLYSTDTIHWHKAQLPGNQNYMLSSIAYNNGKFVTFDADKSILLYSTDALTWQAVHREDLPLLMDSYIFTLNGLFILGAYNVSMTEMNVGKSKSVIVSHEFVDERDAIYSIDGIEWTKKTPYK